jgi:hypothetical protein
MPDDQTKRPSDMNFRYADVFDGSRNAYNEEPTDDIGIIEVWTEADPIQL